MKAFSHREKEGSSREQLEKGTGKQLNREG